MRVLLFNSCLTETFFPRTLVATVRVLEHLGVEVHVPMGQTCCGQPLFNNGQTADAVAIADRFVREFSGDDPIVTPSASCAAMIRDNYPKLLQAVGFDAQYATTFAGRVQEFGEFLAKLNLNTALPVASAGNSPSADPLHTCHESCHLRVLGRHGESHATLRSWLGNSLVQLNKWDQCCGFGGTFSVKYPLISNALLRDKVDAIRTSAAQVVICPEAGCRLNIEGACHRDGMPVRFVSLAEWLAERWGLM